MRSPLQQQLPRALAGALIVVALATGTATAAPLALGRVQPTAATTPADSGFAGTGSSSGSGILPLLVLCALGIEHFPDCNMNS